MKGFFSSDPQKVKTLIPLVQKVCSEESKRYSMSKKMWKLNWSVDERQ